MNDPKILILVLSYNSPPFDELMRMQQSTWDSVEVEGVRTVYYYGGGKGWVNEKEFSADTDDLYYRMHWKLALVLKEIEKWEWKPDFIWRTNSSSYCNKQLLVKHCHNLPKENLYSGYTILDSNDFNGLSVSGAGILVTPDCVKVLTDNLDGEMNCEEDILISRILRKNGIVAIDDKSRYDVPEVVPDDMPTDLYHYRVKHGGSRLLDAENMRLIHEKIIST